MKIDKKTIVLKNDRICLRWLTPADITDEYIIGLNDSEINRYLVDVRRSVQTRESVEKFVIFNMNDPACILFGIFVKDDEKPFVGTIRVHGIDLFHYTANIGICIFAKRAWKKGYAFQGIRLVNTYLFETLGLHYIEAGAYAKNKNSINAFGRAGFSEWYRVKNKARLVDSFEEIVYFAAINSHFDLSRLK